MNTVSFFGGCVVGFVACIFFLALYLWAIKHQDNNTNF